MSDSGAGRLSLDGRVAVVSGGAGGIGSAVVRELIGAGATVACVDRPEALCPPGAEWFPCDLADAAAIELLAVGLTERLDRIDLLVHCAGITRDAVLWKIPPADWSEVLRVNLDSAFHLLRVVVPVMRRGGRGGAVVLVSSINGERGKFGQANYAASKAGLIGLARTAARETGAFGIRVNVVAPGMIETEMSERLPEKVREAAAAESALGRLGQPDDVARAVLFLGSEAARHITGQVLRVDGGQLIG